MKYYGNDPYIEGSYLGCGWLERQNRIANEQEADDKTMKIRGRNKRVQMIGLRSAIFESISAAAKYAGIRQPTMSQWCRDGKEHNGSKWMIIK